MFIKQRIIKILNGQTEYFLMSSLNDWLYVPLKNISLIWRRHHCRWRAAKYWHMLGSQGLWTGRDIYHVTPAAIRDLGFSGLIRRTTPLSRLLRHTRGCGGSILTQILTGSPVWPLTSKPIRVINSLRCTEYKVWCLSRKGSKDIVVCIFICPVWTLTFNLKSCIGIYFPWCTSPQSLKSVKQRVLKILSIQYTHMSSLPLDLLAWKFLLVIYFPLCTSL
jgi:hypothetical protein